MVELERRLRPYRQAVCDKLREGVPALRDVKPHVGAFGVETLKRFSLVVPAARLSFLGMRGIQRNNVGQLIGPCTMVAFVLAKDAYADEAYSPALDLAEEIADFIDMNTFGLPYCAAAYVTEIEPIYSEAIDEMGAALVSITFRQEVSIGRSRHEIDEAGFYPDWYDPEVVAQGWPDTITGNASSNMGVPNLFTEHGGHVTPPQHLVEDGPHPEEDEELP
jgi:hypothetical protein